MPAVTVFEGDGWTRFTVKEEPYGWLEAWRYAHGGPNVYAYQCTPITRLPDDPAGNAIRVAMA